MLADHAPILMRQRPANLPDYKAPPVTEVVVGVQFNALAGLRSAHLGVIWETFRTDFPKVEDHPPLAPVYETFGQNPAIMPMINLSFGAETPRVFFVNHENSLVLQVQRDRFIHNWRKVAATDAYPRFEQMLETFEHNYDRLQDALDKLGLPKIEPNQCELTYINQIESGGDESVFATVGRMFPAIAMSLALDAETPEDFRFMVRYALKDQAKQPYGRMIVSAEPALRFDGKLIVQLTFTARGRPSSASKTAVIEFLTAERAKLVNAFRALTDERMQTEKWGRRQ